MSLHESIIGVIGTTPLVRMNVLTNGLAGEVYLKLESMNPFGSVKDRIAKNMLQVAIEKGELRKGMTVLEPTSGNTGIGLAAVAATLGFDVELVMPETVSLERKTLLLLLGAKLVLTPGPFGMRGAIAMTREMVANSPGKYFVPSQFENANNPAIHERTTGPEIWRDMNGRVDVFVSGIGTSGTIVGVARFLRSQGAKTKIVGIEPEESRVISGGVHTPHKIQGIGAGLVPPVLDRSLIDVLEPVSSIEAIQTAKACIRKEGIPVGISGGAAIAVALRYARKEENAGKKIVAIIPSYTERYLSTVLAEDERGIASAIKVSEPKPELMPPVDEKKS